MEEGRKKMGEKISSVRDLVVYQKSFESAMKIFEISKKFPREEMFSLTDQIRRSTRSVCTSLAEAWRKRRYKAVFVNKLTDAQQEAAETQTWLEFALKCHYIDEQTFASLDKAYEEIFAMLFSMERKADTFCRQQR
jgi:four helix bundle protein